MPIGVVFEVVGYVLTCPLGMPLPLLLYPRGWVYKEGNQVGYNMISNKTLSLLIYFTYISIDIIIYSLWSTSWSSKISWMVGWVVTNHSLGLPSPCDVVPWALNLVNSPQVLGKWVDARWTLSSLSVMNLPLNSKGEINLFTQKSYFLKYWINLGSI
jgi:hypothetical protein